MSLPLWTPAQDGTPAPAFAVALVPGAIGWHVGLLYTPDQGDPRFQHLAWHLMLCDEPMPTDVVAVVPSPLLLAWELRRLTVRALAFWQAHQDGRIPYALESAGARISEDGALHLNGRHGMTCASFVAVFFESAGLPLVALETWSQRSPDRVAEDSAAQQRLVSFLAQNHPGQAQRISSEIGCTRLRPEEIAAASGMQPLPVPFLWAEPRGQALLVSLAS